MGDVLCSAGLSSFDDRSLSYRTHYCGKRGARWPTYCSLLLHHHHIELLSWTFLLSILLTNNMSANNDRQYFSTKPRQ